MSDQNSIRINKYLSERGPYSRRGIDKLINEKRILVNGKLIKPGFKVNTDDEIKIDGETISIIFLGKLFLDPNILILTSLSRTISSNILEKFS